MEELYHLQILERDDYYSRWDTFHCKKIKILERVTCKDTYIEGDKVLRNRTFEKLKVEGEKYLVTLKPSDSYFKTPEEVRDHLMKEYISVWEDKHYLVLLDRNNLNKNVVIDKPQASMGYTKEVLPLYELISI